MPTPLSPAAQLLHRTLQQLGASHNGLGGNCARVARVLDEVLDAGGDYVVVCGEHYEFADHVFLRWEDRLWDIQGAHTTQQAQAQWCSAEDEDEDDEVPTLEDFEDPSGSLIERMADPNGVFAGGFDVDAFRQALLARLAQVGFPLSEDPAPPPSPRALRR
jgi:hypothetical protein